MPITGFWNHLTTGSENPKTGFWKPQTTGFSNHDYGIPETPIAGSRIFDYKFQLRRPAGTPDYGVLNLPTKRF